MLDNLVFKTDINMSHNGYYTELRLKLDYVFTYKSKKEAMAVARACLKEVTKANIPSEIVYFKGQVEIIKGNLVSAIEFMDEAIKLNPKDGAAYNDRALAMIEIGILDGPLQYFDKGIEVEPDFATIHHNKGWFLNNLGRHTEAIKCLNTALELEPDRAVTYDNLADAYFNLGDYKKSLEAYKKVLELLKPGEAKGIRKQILKHIKQIEEKGKVYGNKVN